MNSINHAIIGCGRIAQNHVNACLANGMTVVCCCDLDRNKCEAFATKNNIPRWTDNYLELVDDVEIDSISICTDHGSHVDIANHFVGKKHIIIEKPLSSHIKKAAIKGNSIGKIISVIAQHRFDYLVNLVKLIIDNGDLGEVTLVNGKLQCYRSPEYYSESYWRGTLEHEGGSTVINQSYHIVDTILYLFGKPQKIHSFKQSFKYQDIIETEDTCVAIFQYPKMLVTFSSTNTAIMDWSTNIEVVGTKGSIAFTIDFPEDITDFYVSDDIKKKYAKELAVVQKNYESNLLSAANYYGLSHNAQFKNYVEAIAGQAEIRVDVQSAMDTLSVIEGIYNSANL